MTRPTASRQCAAPACPRFLSPRWPHTTCPACMGVTDTPRPRDPRPGTRAARVYVPTTTTLPHYSAVTLPREPWHTA